MRNVVLGGDEVIKCHFKFVTIPVMGDLACLAFLGHVSVKTMKIHITQQEKGGRGRRVYKQKVVLTFV